MNSVRCPCPQCGAVLVPAENVVLTVSPGGASYLFTCNCGGRYYKGCSEQIADLLATVAVVERITLEEHTGPPLTKLDAIDFALELYSGTEWVDELT